MSWSKRSFLIPLLSILVTVFSITPSQAVPLIVGGFDLTRGGIESLAPGADVALANDIASAFPGTTFQFANTLTPAFLSGVNVVVLGDAVANNVAITPLSASEQAALKSFVLGGGTALIFSDNSTFSANAPQANASVLSPFGVTAAGTLSGAQTAPILDPTGPLTGPNKPVTQFATNFPGFFTNVGGGKVLAEFNSDPQQAAIAYFAPGTLGAQSGKVVLFSDSNAMIAGDSLTTTNRNLVLNALAPVPLPGAMILFAPSLLLLGIFARQRSLGHVGKVPL
jgi:hypothetical protein